MIEPVYKLIDGRPVLDEERSTKWGDPRFGYFIGEVSTDWLRETPNDARMVLTQKLVFVDANGVRWEAPAGRLTDGASIPKPVRWWKDPYSGAHRFAAVIHDIACDDGETGMPQPGEVFPRRWEDVHRVFHSACRCAGVASADAWLMYQAVYHFGPRW